MELFGPFPQVAGFLQAANDNLRLSIGKHLNFLRDGGRSFLHAMV